MYKRNETKMTFFKSWRPKRSHDYLINLKTRRKHINFQKT